MALVSIRDSHCVGSHVSKETGTIVRCRENRIFFLSIFPGDNIPAIRTGLAEIGPLTIAFPIAYNLQIRKLRSIK